MMSDTKRFQKHGAENTPNVRILLNICPATTSCSWLKQFVGAYSITHPALTHRQEEKEIFGGGLSTSPSEDEKRCRNKYKLAIQCPASPFYEESKGLYSTGAEQTAETQMYLKMPMIIAKNSFALPVSCI